MKASVLTTCLLFVLATACNSSRKATTGMATTDMLDPIGVVEKANSYGGLTQMPLDIATQVIDGYIGKLSPMPSAAAVVRDLEVVKEEINSGIIDRGEVGAALNRMAATTRAMAPDGSPYASLGVMLGAAGEQLVGDKLTD